MTPKAPDLSNPLPFAKMQGIGNDFVVADGRLRTADWADLARTMCDRHRGVGGDGLILLESSEIADYRMRMWNPDGSESEMCGNGLRCLVRYAGRELRDEGAISARVETGAGILSAESRPDGLIAVNMGQAHLTRGEIGMVGVPTSEFREEPIGRYRGTAVGMGNPHVVIFVDDLSGVNLATEGPPLERDALFPARVNVHFAQVISPGEIRMKSWERGAGATLGCGTGSCAVAVAGATTGRTDRQTLIHLPGGDLQLDYRSDGRVVLAGPAEFVFEGEWPLLAV